MPHSRELAWLEGSVGVLAPSDRAVISITGDDAQEWLQGQITNQCEGSKPGDAVYGFVLTLKGRVMADVWAYFHDEGVWLETPDNDVEALLERLDRYIIMEDVDLEHRPNLRVLIAQGPKASAVSDAGWPSDRLGTGGRAWLVERDELDAALEEARTRAVDAGGGWVSDQAWQHANVVRGRPRFGTDFGAWTYPQETGLTEVAVSFNKGCYVGQETVVMLQNRGKAPKVLWRWSIDAAKPPEPKAPIQRGAEVVGEITSAVRTDRDVRGLGFLKRGEEDAVEGLEVGGAAVTALGPVADKP